MSPETEAWAASLRERGSEACLNGLRAFLAELQKLGYSLNPAGIRRARALFGADAVDELLRTGEISVRGGPYDA